MLQGGGRAASRSESHRRAIRFFLMMNRALIAHNAAREREGRFTPVERKIDRL